MNNKKTIQKLYESLQEDLDKITSSSDEYKSLSEKLFKQYDLLTASLNPTDSEILEKYIETENELNTFEVSESFIQGFSLAIQLFIDSLK